MPGNYLCLPSLLLTCGSVGHGMICPYFKKTKEGVQRASRKSGSARRDLLLLLEVDQVWSRIMTFVTKVSGNSIRFAGAVGNTKPGQGLGRAMSMLLVN